MSILNLPAGPRFDWREWARKEIAAVRLRRAEPVTLPGRRSPDSFVDNRPTINTAVRALMPTAAEILEAERTVKELMME